MYLVTENCKKFRVAEGFGNQSVENVIDDVKFDP
jgi:hypothetical protein